MRQVEPIYLHVCPEWPRFLSKTWLASNIPPNFFPTCLKLVKFISWMTFLLIHLQLDVFLLKKWTWMCESAGKTKCANHDVRKGNCMLSFNTWNRNQWLILCEIYILIVRKIFWIYSVQFSLRIIKYLKNLSTKTEVAEIGFYPNIVFSPFYFDSLKFNGFQFRNSPIELTEHDLFHICLKLYLKFSL